MKTYTSIFLSLYFLVFSFSNLYGKEQVYESQPNILFKSKDLLKVEQSVSLETDFNNAVLYLEKEEYLKAINLFKKTSKVFKIPSFLNIGIAYYKLNSTNNAYLYLKKIYDFKEAAKEDTYSYVSASYYLYQLTNDRKYISKIISVTNKIPKKKLTEHLKQLLVDTYIVFKDYDMAIKIALTMKAKDELKLALLYIKKRDFGKASVYLESAHNKNSDREILNSILWFKTFVSLRTNNIATLKDNILEIGKNVNKFNANKKLPIKIFFNPKKYDSSQYFERVTKFSDNRQMDMIFYFAPFIFIDKKEIYNDSMLGFVLKNPQNINLLDMMVDYNKNFIQLVKLDPIVRVIKLQELIDKKYDVKSYEYYNLALCYAHNFDFRNAHKYFKKAYDLSRSNKLYAAMTLISAKRGDIAINKDYAERIKKNLLDKDGSYKYLGKYIYKLTYDPNYKLDGKGLSEYDKKSIFLRALSFLEKMKDGEMKENEPLLLADVKDPMVYLFRSLVKKQNESDYNYMARLQDSIPKTYNDYFLKGPSLITQYYIEVVRSLGVFNKIDFDIKNERTPSYLRTKAIVQLYDGFPNATIKIIESLRNSYGINDIYTMDLLSAAYLSAGDTSNAMAKIGEMQFEYNDTNAKFLSGVQLLQNLKTNSASLLFSKKYDGFFIDFEMENFDDFVESL